MVLLELKMETRPEVQVLVQGGTLLAAGVAGLDSQVLTEAAAGALPVGSRAAAPVPVGSRAALVAAGLACLDSQVSTEAAAGALPVGSWVALVAAGVADSQMSAQKVMSALMVAAVLD